MEFSLVFLVHPTAQSLSPMCTEEWRLHETKGEFRTRDDGQFGLEN
jgi:hypothetical protein